MDNGYGCKVDKAKTTLFSYSTIENKDFKKIISFLIIHFCLGKGKSAIFSSLLTKLIGNI